MSFPMYFFFKKKKKKKEGKNPTYFQKSQKSFPSSPLFFVKLVPSRLGRSSCQSTRMCVWGMSLSLCSHTDSCIAHTKVLVRMFVFSYVCVCVCTYINKCSTNTYMHIHTHTTYLICSEKETDRDIHALKNTEHA